MEESKMNESPSSFNGDISERASEKIKEIKKAQEELDEIQKECKHTSSSIQNVSPAGCTFSLRKVCSDCEKILSYPTVEESKKWMS